MSMHSAMDIAILSVGLSIGAPVTSVGRLYCAKMTEPSCYQRRIVA